MRAILILLTLCAAAAPVRGQRTLDERYAAAPSGFIRIHSIVGSVRVTGWDSDSVAVTGTVSETKLDRFEVHGAYEGSKMGFFGEGTQLKPSHLEVRVPAGSQVWVKTASADVTVTGVTGGVDVYSVSGRLEVGGTPREVFVESMGGAVRVAADTRTVRARTASGDITVAGAVTDVIATSVSGRVTAEGGAFERGRFESVDGDILFAGEIRRGSWLDFINHSGAIEVVVPRATSADFALTLFEGGFQDEFGVRPTYGGNKLKGQQVGFTLGAGGAHVTVRNFKGRTILRAR
jgi:DUF4097 and DUF4098 domain-containing protein YvlB